MRGTTEKKINDKINAVDHINLDCDIISAGSGDASIDMDGLEWYFSCAFFLRLVRYGKVKTSTLGKNHFYKIWYIYNII